MNTTATPLKSLFAGAILVFLMFASVSTYAQTTFGDDVDDQALVNNPDDPGDPGDGDPPTDPIDGGIYAGIAAAGIVGYTFTRAKKANI